MAVRNAENLCGLGWLGGTQGQRQCYHSIERVRLSIRLFYLLPFSRYNRLFVESRRFSPTSPAFGALVGGDPIEFRGDLWHQKTSVPGVSCGVVCVILRFAVLVELRLATDRQTDGQTDRQTDTGPWLVPRMHSIAR